MKNNKDDALKELKMAYKKFQQFVQFRVVKTFFGDDLGIVSFYVVFLLILELFQDNFWLPLLSNKNYKPCLPFSRILMTFPV